MVFHKIRKEDLIVVRNPFLMPFLSLPFCVTRKRHTFPFHQLVFVHTCCFSHSVSVQRPPFFAVNRWSLDFKHINLDRNCSYLRAYQRKDLWGQPRCCMQLAKRLDPSAAAEHQQQSLEHFGFRGTAPSEESHTTTGCFFFFLKYYFSYVKTRESWTTVLDCLRADVLICFLPNTALCIVVAHLHSLNRSLFSLNILIWAWCFWLNEFKDPWNPNRLSHRSSQTKDVICWHFEGFMLWIFRSWW